MNAYDRRVAIANRFVERIAAGDAVFSGIGPTAGLPCTMSGGITKHLGGMNSLMLLQIMKDQRWNDPRFFTLDQVKESGWAVREGAKKVALQFFQSTGPDGLPLAQPEATSFRVYNASEIDGVDPFEGAPRAPVADISAAVLAAFPEAPPGDLRSGIAKLMETFDVIAPTATAADRALRIAVAVTFVEAQTLPLGPAAAPLFQEQWITELSLAPMNLYPVVRDAALLSSKAIRAINAVTMERETADAIARARDDRRDSTDSRIVQDKKMAQKTGATARTEALFAERVAILAVPFAERTKASALGAVWYPPQSLWFVPPGLSTGPFAEWNPRAHTLGEVATERVLIEEFKQAMASIGLDTSKDVIADGKWHNVAVDSKKKVKNLSGSYIFSLDGARDGGAIGTINNKDTGEQLTWRYEGALLTPEQRARFRQEALAREAIAARELVGAQAAAAVTANEVWEKSGPAEGNGYAQKKGISTAAFRQAPGSLLRKFPEFSSESGASAIRANEKYLIVPMRNAQGELRAVQAVSQDGSIKSFMRGAQKNGLMLVLGADSLVDLSKSAPASVSYVEGAATGVSFHKACNTPVVICFDAGNMETVAEETVGMFPATTKRIFAIDNDQFFIERAAGMLSEKLGLNPHTPNGQRVAIRAGAESIRALTLGEIVADGEWHETARGTYRVSLNLDSERVAVDSAVVDVVPTGGRKMMATFQNRGLQAGRACMKAVEKLEKSDGASAMIAMPEFKSLAGRPTDWNDLDKQEGPGAISALVPVLAPQQSPAELPARRVGENRRLASLSR
jgi:phage/plasmid primase-like uncharacterized protein